MSLGREYYSVWTLFAEFSLSVNIYFVLLLFRRLIHDRELSLFDGTRLLRHDRFDEIKTKFNLSDEDMNGR